MPAPIEFSPEYVAEHSPREERLYESFLKSGEPYKTLYRKAFHVSAKDGYVADPADAPSDGQVPGLDLADDSLYYNTGGSARAYWSGYRLPVPEKDIRHLRRDLREWGYCLIDAALSSEQLQRMKQRLDEQAAGERLAGVASFMGTPPRPDEEISSTQFVHTLINKGRQFVECVEHDPAGVQAGPVIEQLLNETMGRNFLMSCFIAIITNKNNMPQGLHQDQAIAPFQDPAAPFTVNTMFILDDMGEHNGGTLVVPGSHRILSEAGSGNAPDEPLPPAINLEAPAGTVMIFEGRLLHGTGVNKSDTSRTILVMNSVKPFMRQQELHMLSAAPEILENASDKLLYRLGAKVFGLGGVEGAWNGDFQVDQRLRLERGEYVRIGELSPNSSLEELSRDYGYRYSDSGYKQRDHQPGTDKSVAARLKDAGRGWHMDDAYFPRRPKEEDK